MLPTLKKLLIALLLFTALLLLGGRALRATTPAPACDRMLLQPGCLYVSSAHYAVAPVITDTISYTDIAGLTRIITIAISVPITAPTPLPVVIWSHGGATGHTNPVTSMAEWGATTAAAGYLTISIAHTSRSYTTSTTIDTRTPLCKAVATAVPGEQWDLSEPATCDQFKYLNWDRPHDISAVLDELERRNAQGALQGRIDLTRIAVGGHSSGSSGALTVAGALRNFTGTPIALADHRPAVFLAFSPQQIGSEGFFDTAYQRSIHSWQPITRPVLLGTGDGDSTCDPLAEPGSCFGDMPYGRRIVFERMIPGSKYLLYFHDADAFHEIFALNTDNDKCGASVRQQKCDEMARVLRAVALAFLDDALLGDPVARQWLGRNDVEIATNGVAEWRYK